MLRVNYADSLQKDYLFDFGRDVWVIGNDYMLIYMTPTDSADLVDSGYTVLAPEVEDRILRGVMVTIPPDRARFDSVLALGLDIVWRDADTVYALAMDRHLLNMDSSGIDYYLTYLTYPDTLQSKNKSRLPIPDDQKYHSYNTADDEFRSLTDELGVFHSSPICDTMSIGETYFGRKLYAIKISDADEVDDEGHPEKKILIIGGIHAREWIGVEVPFRLAEFLINGYQAEPQDPVAKYIVENFEVWAVPMVNPDGHEYSRTNYRFWRKNLRDNGDYTWGVDINRNFNVGRDGTSPEPIGRTSDWSGSDSYWGPYAQSEPETAAIVWLMIQKGFAAAIDFHSYSQLVMYPWGITENPPPNVCTFKELTAEMRRLIDDASDLTGEKYTDQQIKDLYTLSGSFSDWMYKHYNIPSIAIELRPAYSSIGECQDECPLLDFGCLDRCELEFFDLPGDQITPTWQEIKPGLIYFFNWVKQLDFGDARDTYDYSRDPNNYPSRLAHNGARHDDIMWEWLGPCVDPEEDSRQINKDNHDDGVEFNEPLKPEQTSTIDVEMRASILYYPINGHPVIYDRNRYSSSERLRLFGWFDWNGDGDWQDEGELVVDDEFWPNDLDSWSQIDDKYLTGVLKHKQYTVTPPDDLYRGIYYSRFRLGYTSGWDPAPYDLARYGEVEDYALSGPDFGDAPPPYITCPEEGGPSHETAGVYEWLGENRVRPTRRVTIEYDADDPYDEDGEPNLGPAGCCGSADGCEDGDEGDKMDDGFSYACDFSNCRLAEAVIHVSTSGKRAMRYAHYDNEDSVLYVNLFIDWEEDGSFTGSGYCAETGAAIPDHVVFQECFTDSDPGYGDGVVNTLPDDHLVINPNLWNNGTDTLWSRSLHVKMWVPFHEDDTETWARLRLDYGYEDNTDLPTGQVDYGEVEDFKFRRLPADDGSIDVWVTGDAAPVEFWTQEGEKMTGGPIPYSFLSGGINIMQSDVTYGELDFRAEHPEFNGQSAYIEFNWKGLLFPDPWVTDFFEVLTYTDPRVIELTVANLVDFPWDYEAFDSLPDAGWRFPLVGPLNPDGPIDTIFMAVNLGMFIEKNPFWINDVDPVIGTSLSEMGIEIVDGRIDGVEGMCFATSRLVFDPDAEIGFTPEGGPSTWLNSADSPYELGILSINGNVPLIDIPKAYSALRIEKTHGTLQGHFQDVSIFIDSSSFEMGGFDLLIAYDATALSFVEAAPGQLLEDCDWEYFTYRHGITGNCGDACPSGLLRIIALAETNNGANHPSCFGLIPMPQPPGVLANLKFYVTNDRNFNCHYVPITFFWDDCGDNSVSSVDGQNLYIERTVRDFEGSLIWDEGDDAQFPENDRIPFVGAPDYCLNPDPEKPSALRFLDFVDGGIDIVCRDSIDAPCDINGNGVPYEIADAVLFVNCFISSSLCGEAAIAASDCNGDGVPMSIADLVYLIRVIIGDAVPYPKPLPQVSDVDVALQVNHSAVAVAVNSTIDIGGGYFEFEHSGYEIGEPQLINGASDMTIKYGDENGILRVLVYSLEENRKIPAGIEHIFAVPISGEGTIVLRDVELSDYVGNLLTARIDTKPDLPATYALHQNYPNPFNATTTIMYELPANTHVTIAVFNTLGQKVATLIDREEEAGVHSAAWDGTDQSGTTVASGVYIYRISTSEFTAEKKMVVMK